MKVKAFLPASGNDLVNIVYSITALGCALIACACSADPTARHAAAAAARGLQAESVAGAGFTHRVYAAARSGAAADSSVLHVYYGGDGSPFLDGRRIARDPTPRRPLTLALMQQDPFPAVFIGRPCYHGLLAGCDSALWTVARYSPAVVESMAAATSRVIEARAPARVVLVGYSGGGALALLVAERLDRIDAVVTVAANLDVAAWTQRHGYTPLHESLDPADVAGSRADLAHLHLSGSADDNVPPATAEPTAHRHACRAWPGCGAGQPAFRDCLCDSSNALRFSSAKLQFSNSFSTRSTYSPRSFWTSR